MSKAADGEDEEGTPEILDFGYTLLTDQLDEGGARVEDIGVSRDEKSDSYLVYRQDTLVDAVAKTEFGKAYDWARYLNYHSEHDLLEEYPTLETESPQTKVGIQ